MWSRTGLSQPVIVRHEDVFRGEETGMETTQQTFILKNEYIQKHPESLDERNNGILRKQLSKHVCSLPINILTDSHSYNGTGLLMRNRGLRR